MTNDSTHTAPATECAGQISIPGLEYPRTRHRVRPATVLCSAQQVSRVQRAGRYLPETVKHPARMLPALARHLIEAYTAPHELVLDPMCGIGTTLIEAMHLGRSAVGVEYERQWAHLAQRGINHARLHGAQGAGFLWNADARNLPADLVTAARGRVKLLLTSPPYGPSCHGQVKVDGRAGHRGQIDKSDFRYSKDRCNLARRPARDLVAGFAQILQAAHPLLAPGGHVAVTARPWRREGRLIDLPSAVISAGRAAGLVPAERLVALLARCEETSGHDGAAGAGCGCAGGGEVGHGGERLIAHGSFFQLDSTRRALAAGIPRALITHEDVIILRKPAADLPEEAAR